MSNQSTENKISKKSDYRAKDITVLEGLDPVRKRPAMYIGSTGIEGLHHLIWEAVDNSIDEAMAGYCDSIEVAILPENAIRVSDNGRGIPVDIHSQTKKSALELVMTKLHAGGKFDNNAYKVSGGLHGVGISCVNALSTWLRAEVRRDGKIYVQEYKIGKPQAKVKSIGKTSENGTTVIFKPDETIFKTTEFNFKTILTHLRQQAYLTKGVKIKIRDERNQNEIKEYNFYFEGGLISYIKHLNHNNKKEQQNIFYVEKESEGIKVEVALQYTDEYKESVFTFANNIFTVEGGTHLSGFKAALTRSINAIAREKAILKDKEDNLSGDDIREGLTAVISVKVPDPQFEGQTKSKLGNPEGRTAVETVFAEAFNDFLRENPADANNIIKKCLLASRARQAAKSARETVLRKGVLDGMTLPGKLADCSNQEPEKCELFIVEGDSAGGSAKQGRDREFQAILPLRGKILNVERTRLDKILANEEIKSLIIAMGTSIGEEFEVERLRYHKVIIMTDADVDGSHIQTLLLTLFYRYFQNLIIQGNLYIAQPPLYKVKSGKESKYIYSDEELTSFKNKLAKTKTPIEIKNLKQDAETGFSKKEINDEEIEDKVDLEAKLDIQRYKGLGEMNPDQLWETTMNPDHRVLKQVKIEDAEEADHIFETLMGKEVQPRKIFIQTHAKRVKNLDI
ncbi:MAG: DNA topoisomerase (ATP-hydrolyzing) subunit B [Patescibacteria group bacterium]|nr:DNA topoisomerase (ATP-hydrolyzing) subunit B [Patescibacteria group bacterium]